MAINPRLFTTAVASSEQRRACSRRSVERRGSWSLAQALPGQILAEGAGALWNIHMSVKGPKAAEILMFNSGGMGARPGADGLSATAFPSGVMTMPIEATEQAGPVVIWRKELRPDSGGAGRFRGGLGQVIEIAPEIAPALRHPKHDGRCHRLSVHCGPRLATQPFPFILERSESCHVQPRGHLIAIQRSLDRIESEERTTSAPGECGAPTTRRMRRRGGAREEPP